MPVQVNASSEAVKNIFFSPTPTCPFLLCLPTPTPHSVDAPIVKVLPFITIQPFTWLPEANWSTRLSWPEAFFSLLKKYILQSQGQPTALWKLLVPDSTIPAPLHWCSHQITFKAQGRCYTVCCSITVAYIPRTMGKKGTESCGVLCRFAQINSRYTLSAENALHQESKFIQSIMLLTAYTSQFNYSNQIYNENANFLLCSEGFTQ